MNILSNKIALVTGACSEVGKAIVEEFVSKGLKVVGLSNDINKLKVHLTLTLLKAQTESRASDYGQFNKSGINKLLFTSWPFLSLICRFSWTS